MYYVYADPKHIKKAQQKADKMHISTFCARLFFYTLSVHMYIYITYIYLLQNEAPAAAASPHGLLAPLGHAR